jgi:hypothetical protein
MLGRREREMLLKLFAALAILIGLLMVGWAFLRASPDALNIALTLFALAAALGVWRIVALLERK